MRFDSMSRGPVLELFSATFRREMQVKGAISIAPIGSQNWRTMLSCNQGRKMEKQNQSGSTHPIGSFPFTDDSRPQSERAHDLEIRFRDQNGTYNLRFNLNPEVRARRGGGRRIP